MKMKKHILKQYKVTLYHIGSTAIPNIYSKDIIDISIKVMI